MGKYIIKRVAMGILSIFIVATLTFLLMNLVPGGPFVAEKSISKEAQAACKELSADIRIAPGSDRIELFLQEGEESAE